MSEISIDEKDKKILRELEKNSRQSVSSIAKTVGLSKEVVNYRIKNMMKEGIIELFITPFNYTRMGYFQSKVLIKFSNFTPSFEKTFISFMKEVDNVYWLVHCSGDYDVQVIFQTKTVSQLEKSYFQVINKFSKNISKHNFCIISERYYLRHNCIYDERVDLVDVASLYGSAEQPSDIDVKIIKIIKRNSRVPVLDIAKKVGVSSATVMSRLKHMVQDNWIKGFFLRINLKLLGYSQYSVFYKFKNMDLEGQEEFTSYLCSRKDVGFIGKMIGAWDFDVEVQAKNEYELHKILDEIGSKFSKYIYDYSYLLIIKKYSLYTSEV